MPPPRKFRFNCLDRPVQCTHIHNNRRINFSIISESTVTHNNNNSGYDPGNLATAPLQMADKKQVADVNDFGICLLWNWTAS